MKQLKRDAWEFINRSKHRRYISSIPQLNRNSIEFFLSTQTRSSSKTSQSKSLQIGFERRRKEKYKVVEKFIERIKKIQEEAKAALGKA